MGFTAEQAAQEILRAASDFLNLRETANNAAWDNPDTAGQDPAARELRRLLEAVGWQAGWPYCMAFCKAIYHLAYTRLGAEPRVLRLILERFTPSVLQTYKNCGRFAQSKEPCPGAIFFMQKGASSSGHAGLVVTPGQTSFATIEGNTSPSPGSAAADREGDGVYKKVRTLAFGAKPDALWLRGFLNPLSSDEIAELLPLRTRAARGRRRPARSATRLGSKKNVRGSRRTRTAKRRVNRRQPRKAARTGSARRRT